MQAKLITQDQRNEWNALADQEPSFALLQSWEWGEFKATLGWKVFRVVVEDQGHFIAGAQLLIRSIPLGLASVAYVPRGPIGSWLDPEIATQLFTKLHHIARSHRAVFLKIEPPLLNDPSVEAALKAYTFFSSDQRNQPCATLILDLSPDTNTILKSLRKKTRQYINSSLSAGVVVREGEQKDLPAFFNLLRHTGQREHFPTHPHSYYEQEWKTFAPRQEYVLFLAYFQDQLIAARTVHRFGKHASEFHAGSIDAFSHLHPNYLLTWTAITWAKTAGCQSYDMWGIPDEIALRDPTQDPKIVDAGNGLWGVYQFKRGFTKNVVCYAGAFDYVYNWPIYRLLTAQFFSQDLFANVAVLLDLFDGSLPKSRRPGSSLVDQNHTLENI